MTRVNVGNPPVGKSGRRSSPPLPSPGLAMVLMGCAMPGRAVSELPTGICAPGDLAVRAEAPLPDFS